jgi:hypothetical protein
MEGFSEDVDVAQIQRDPTTMVWVPSSRARPGGDRRGADRPFWAILGSCRRSP